MILALSAVLAAMLLLAMVPAPQTVRAHRKGE